MPSKYFRYSIVNVPSTSIRMGFKDMGSFSMPARKTTAPYCNKQKTETIVILTGGATAMKLLLGSGGLRTAERVQFFSEQVRSFFGPISRLLFVPYALGDHD